MKIRAQTPVTVNLREASFKAEVSAHSNNNTPIQILCLSDLRQPVRDTVEQTFHVKQGSPAYNRRNLLNSDIIFVDPKHPNADRYRIKTSLLPSAAIKFERPMTTSQMENEFASLVRASREINCLIHELDPLADVKIYKKTVMKRLGFVIKRVLQRAGDSSNPDPDFCRTILDRIDIRVLPGLKAVEMPLSFVFPSADQWLIAPLGSFHKDEAALLKEVRALNISPPASRDFFAANAAHLRFVKYDDFDILMLPMLMRGFFPRLSECLSHAGTPNFNREETRSYICSALMGLTMLVDYGAFDQLFVNKLKYRHPTPPKPIAEDKLRLFNITLNELNSELQVYGQEFIRLMRKAMPIFPELFTDRVPSWLEFRNGSQAFREIVSIVRFNRKLPVKISASEVWCGSNHAPVEEYRQQHKIHAVQFSNTAWAHHFHGREIWRRFVAFLDNREPVLTRLSTTGRPTAELRQAYKLLDSVGALLKRMEHLNPEIENAKMKGFQKKQLIEEIKMCREGVEESLLFLRHVSPPALPALPPHRFAEEGCIVVLKLCYLKKCLHNLQAVQRKLSDEHRYLLKRLQQSLTKVWDPLMEYVSSTIQKVPKETIWHELKQESRQGQE